MRSVRVPNFWTTEDHSYEIPNTMERSTLPKNSFVKPIEDRYLPRHITDDKKYKYFNPETEIYCHTKFGLIPVPKRILKER